MLVGISSPFFLSYSTTHLRRNARMLLRTQETRLNTCESRQSFAGLQQKKKKRWTKFFFCLSLSSGLLWLAFSGANGRKVGYIGLGETVEKSHCVIDTADAAAD